MEKINAIMAVCGALLGGVAGFFLLSPLGYWFPEEKDFKGALIKSRDNKKIRILTGVITGLLCGVSAYFAENVLVAILNVIFTCALAVIFTVDFRTYEIPFKINVLIFLLGIVRVIALKDILQDMWLYIIGFFAVSVPLAAIFYLSRGTAIGFGDVKMMAACGMLIGWKNAESVQIKGLWSV